jgi:hypothetical protein
MLARRTEEDRMTAEQEERQVGAWEGIMIALDRLATVEEERWAERQSIEPPTQTPEELQRQEKQNALTDADIALKEARVAAGVDGLTETLSLGYHIHDVANHVFDGTLVIADVPVAWQSRIQAIVDKRSE